MTIQKAGLAINSAVASTRILEAKSGSDGETSEKIKQ
jgi:hypothetical protein